jgi:hypothetical protein
MKKIIFGAREKVTQMDASKVGVLVECAGVPVIFRQGSTEGMMTVDAYGICNHNQPLRENEDTLIELFNHIKQPGKDIVFACDYGKNRSRELATAFGIFLNQPIHKAIMDEDCETFKVEWDYTTTATNYTDRLKHLLDKGAISLPEDFKPLQVCITNSTRWPENYAIEELRSDGELSFLRAGYWSAEEADAAAKAYNMQVVYHRVVPQAK